LIYNITVLASIAFQSNRRAVYRSKNVIKKFIYKYINIIKHQDPL